MTMKTQTKLFDSYAQAEATVLDLEAAGFSDNEVSIVGNGAPAATAEDTGQGEAASSGADVGASVGTIVGGTVGLLAGLGALAIPGIGPVVAAGWLVALVTGAGAGAAAGGLIGSLTSSGVDEQSAHVYAEGVRRGGTLVSVRTDDNRRDQVAAILAGHDSVNITTREAAYRADGWNGYRDADTAVLPVGNATNRPDSMASRAGDNVPDSDADRAHRWNRGRRA